MKNSLLLLPFGLMALLSSCSSVLIPEPLVSTTEPELREELEGVWLVEEGAIHVAFTEKGQGEIAFIEREEEKFKLERGELAAVEFDDRTYLSVRFEEDGEMMEKYYLAEFKTDDSGNLIAWPADVDRFGKAVNDGELEGVIEKSKYSTVIELKSDNAALLRFLTQNPDGVATRSPIVLRKLK